MNDINDVYNFVQFELNKHQSGSTLNKSEFNLCCRVVNLEYYKTQIGLPEEYQIGSPTSRIAYENTQLITDRMKTFKMLKGGRNFPVLAIDSDGQALYPVDYVHYSSIRYNNRPVVPVRDSEVGDALIDSITAPTEKYPIVVFQSDYLQFYPLKNTFVEFTYLRLPATPFWDTTVVNDEDVYKPSTSVQFEWPSESLSDIANMIVRYAAVNLKSQLNIQVAQERKREGN